ncbi:PSP [Symbiodinium natans]|uniref:PSP protein n=1 Tax=Symbiodinium natans TaxID=878477 RepID=A0A812U065_9DINO|nr:PSP [Symbiodinium natans]
MQRAKDLRSILDDTEKISKAVMLASTTMSMLNAMMQSQANQLPKRGSPQNEAYLSEFERCSQSGLDRTSHWPRRKEVPGADGTSLRHSCGLCEQLAEQLTPAIETLENSLGTALDAARSEVNKQLTGDKLEDGTRMMLSPK